MSHDTTLDLVNGNFKVRGAPTAVFTCKFKAIDSAITAAVTREYLIVAVGAERREVLWSSVPAITPTPTNPEYDILRIIPKRWSRIRREKDNPYNKP